MVLIELPTGEIHFTVLQSGFLVCIIAECTINCTYIKIFKDKLYMYIITNRNCDHSYVIAKEVKAFKKLHSSLKITEVVSCGVKFKLSKFDPELMHYL